jgi:hypothetical protein
MWRIYISRGARPAITSGTSGGLRENIGKWDLRTRTRASVQKVQVGFSHVHSHSFFFKTSPFKRERPSSCGKERAQKVNCCALFRPRTKHDFPNSVCRSPEIKFLSPSFPHTHPLQNGKFRAAHGTIFFSCLDLQKSVNLA